LFRKKKEEILFLNKIPPGIMVAKRS